MEHLDAIVATVDHGHDPTRAEGDVAGTIHTVVVVMNTTKLPLPRPPRSELICERGVGVEHLDALISLIGHGHDPTRAEGDV